MERKKKTERARKEWERNRQRLTERRQAAEARVRAGDWFLAMAGEGVIYIGRDVQDALETRGVDLMDGARAVLIMYQRRGRPTENPAQAEVVFASVTQANPLAGLVLHCLTLDGMVYASLTEFFPY